MLCVYPNVLLCVLPPTLKILTFRKSESGRSLSLDGSFLFLFKRAIDGPKKFCCDTCIRCFLAFLTWLMLSAVLDLVRNIAINQNIWAIVFNNFVHFENFLGCNHCLVLSHHGGVCLLLVEKLLPVFLVRTKMLVGSANAL